MAILFLESAMPVILGITGWTYNFDTDSSAIKVGLTLSHATNPLCLENPKFRSIQRTK